MAVMEHGATPPLPFSEPKRAPETEILALRGALRLETRVAEALACRSRGLIELVEALSRRALDEARDIADARMRLDRLALRLRLALEAGETARPESVAQLAERTLAVFDATEGPRIALSGTAVGLSPEAARLVGLTLFELASRSLRHGALATPDGRAGLVWRLRGDGALHLSWREYGAPPQGSDALRGGAGGALLPLLSERFGSPLRVRVAPFGLRAELTVPAADLALPGPAAPGPGVVLRLDRAGTTPQAPMGSGMCSGSGPGRSSA